MNVSSRAKSIPSLLLELLGRVAEQPLELARVRLDVEPVDAGPVEPGGSSKPGMSCPTIVANGRRRSGPT